MSKGTRGGRALEDLRRKRASGRECEAFAFDIDYTLGDRLPPDLACFHAHYRRENPTTPKRDFKILPQVSGKGRYLGANIGVRAVGDYQHPIWFGEGEIKIYLDGDREWPTLAGTGTEDLAGSTWSLGKFSHQFQGCLLSEKEDGLWAFGDPSALRSRGVQRPAEVA